MSFLDNARKAFRGLSDDDYESGLDYDELDEEEEKNPRRSILSFFTGKFDSYDDEYEEEDEEPASAGYSSYRSSYSRDRYSSRTSSSDSDKSHIRYNPASASTEVILVPLLNFDDSEKLVREVKSGKITLFDVSEIESTEDARRIVDYISGVAAGMECPFSRLCSGIFCIAPKGVKITAKKRFA